ncbi:hypothetical protein CP533_3178 [Ophiocordyceps camponoti-saundersi (nom. inval.)]|nr:hypothetical protein CP533_3178 [Ophiocordyceps camponoti-saundersi (nom. inval.)]
MSHHCLQASRFMARNAAASLCRRRPSPSALLRLRSGLASRRSFAAPSMARPRGIMPHTENPSKPEPAKSETSYGVLELSDNTYHELADAYLDTVLAKFEHLQDSREDIDVEFSAGVMTITVADRGTYVINKQPPNHQIWLSSPISGPKRFDWCVVGEGQGEKEGTGTGSWIYTRDGISLNQLILEELGVDIDGPAETASVLTR